MRPSRPDNHDDLVRRLVQSLEKEIPAATEEKLDAWCRRAGGARPPRRHRRLLLSLTVAAAFMLLVLSLNRMLSFRKAAAGPRQTPFSEIKMEMELKGKNIKIIWFQKEGFNVGNG
jgi:hypothetical protein